MFLIGFRDAGQSIARAVEERSGAGDHEAAAGARPVVGFISTWPVYQGTTIDRHAHALMQGIRAAARDHDCDLLLGAGVSAGSTPQSMAHRVAGARAGHGPGALGPWNTDGLIVVPDDLSDCAAGLPRATSRRRRCHRVHDARGARATGRRRQRGRHPPGVDHLIAHGHRRIAFVAGKEHRGWRQCRAARAFRDAMGEAGLELDARPARVRGASLRGRPRGHAPDPRHAARRSPRSWPATTCRASARSRRSRRRAGTCPEDVAAIGFDDILDARSHAPPLTTVRHPTFALGYAAVTAILDRLARGPAAAFGGGGANPVDRPSVVRLSAGSARLARRRIGRPTSAARLPRATHGPGGLR